jgi:hypothetical protein
MTIAQKQLVNLSIPNKANTNYLHTSIYRKKLKNLSKNN